jgi:hypothetical protein
MFWGGLSLRDSNSAWSTFAYCLLNVALGVWWQRHEEALQARLKQLLPFIPA